MDIQTLVKDLATFLAPFLPYLLKTGDKAAEKLGEQVGKKLVPGLGTRAWQTAQTLWGKLRPKVAAQPAAQEAVQEVVQNPNDADAHAALRLQLKKILAEDETLARELAPLVQTLQHTHVTVIASGERSVAVGGSVSGSVISMGDISKGG